MKEPHCVKDILDDLDELAEQNDEVSIADVVEAFGDRSYGPFLLVPALVELTPLGAVPGVPTFLAVIIALVAAQMLFGKSHLWLPGIIENRSVKADKLARASGKLRGVAKFMDKWFHGRLKHFTTHWYRRLAALVILFLCASVPPLEVLPFASSGPMLAIACFGVAIMVRDGLLMIIATLLGFGAIGLGYTLMAGGEGGSGGG